MVNIYKFRKQITDMGFEMPEVVCALCGKVHTGNTTWRTTRLDNNKEVVDGYYKPQLTIDERWKLGWGEHDICTARAKCEQRQRQNLINEHELNDLRSELLEVQKQLRDVLARINLHNPEWLKNGSDEEQALYYASLVSIDIEPAITKRRR